MKNVVDDRGRKEFQAFKLKEDKLRRLQGLSFFVFGALLILFWITRDPIIHLLAIIPATLNVVIVYLITTLAKEN